MKHINDVTNIFKMCNKMNFTTNFVIIFQIILEFAIFYAKILIKGKHLKNFRLNKQDYVNHNIVCVIKILQYLTFVSMLQKQTIFGRKCGP